jgi:hypothetical protein
MVVPGSCVRGGGRRAGRSLSSDEWGVTSDERVERAVPGSWSVVSGHQGLIPIAVCSVEGSGLHRSCQRCRNLPNSFSEKRHPGFRGPSSEGCVSTLGRVRPANGKCAHGWLDRWCLATVDCSEQPATTRRLPRECRPATDYSQIALPLPAPAKLTLRQPPPRSCQDGCSIG